MREIKFRAWNLTENRFLTTEELIYRIEVEAKRQLRLDNSLISLNGKPDPSDEIIFQQYTGLKDKNGIEIYEGDIIIFDNSDIGGQRYKGVVEWNTDPTLDGLCFGLFIPPKFGGKSGWLRCDFLGELEVVGNVFEGTGHTNE